jgi:HEAT repeat protein
VYDLQEIRTILASPDEELRRGVIASLRGRNLDETAELLLAAMGDASWRVRKEAVQLFVDGRPDERLIERLLDLLHNERNAGLRNSAAEAVMLLGEQSVAPLKRRAADQDAGVRKFVIDVMGGIGSSDFIPDLLAALDDTDVNVAAAAAEHLGGMGNATVVPDLLRSITIHDEVIFRFSALTALGRLGTPGPLPEELRPLLDQALFSKVIYDCLGSIGDQTAAPILLNGFHAPQKSARCAAVKAFNRILTRTTGENRAEMAASLRRLATDEAVGFCLDMLDLGDTADAELTEAVIVMLGIIGDPRAVRPLLEAYTTERFSDTALEALENYGDDALHLLTGIYDESDVDLRVAVCHLIAHHKGDGAADELIRQALQDRSPDVRRAAVRAVALRRLSCCTPLLLALLDDADDGFRREIISCLQSVSRAEREPVLAVAAQLAASSEPHHRHDAVLLYAALGEDASLARFVKDADPEVRCAAVVAMGRLCVSTAQTTLRIALVDEAPEVRIAAAEALGGAGDLTAVPPLTLALNDPDDRVRCAILRSIHRLSPDDIRTVLRDIVPSARGLVMITCLELLELLGDAPALDCVEQVLANPDEEMVKLALEILSRHDAGRVERHAGSLLAHPYAGIRYRTAVALAATPSRETRNHLKAALEKEQNNLVRDRIHNLLEGLQ